MAQPIEAPKTAMQNFLDVVERVGNKVPHPAVIFLILIAIVIVLSQILHMLGTSISYQPDPAKPNGTFSLNYYYFQLIIGWALSLLAAAGFSGLVKTKYPLPEPNLETEQGAQDSTRSLRRPPSLDP
jgi:p-aminobenzoyl-glutamate transporter AbgT